jgi:hypothetical protein
LSSRSHGKRQSESTPFFPFSFLNFFSITKAVYHFIEWRSSIKTNHGIANLLIDLWRAEEKAIGGT